MVIINYICLYVTFLKYLWIL